MAPVRLDAPRLTGLVGATMVIALASSARPDEAPSESAPSESAPSVAAPSVAARFIAPEPTASVAAPSVAAPSVAARFIAPAPSESAPSVAARFIAPAPSESPPSESPPSVAARFIAPASSESAPSVAARFIAPLPSEPSTWTHLESPRPLTIRGRQLTFADIAITDERLTGQRADGPFATNSPTILVHYASWCLPCAAELPEVFALARAFSDISTVEIPASRDISTIKASRGPAHRAPAIVFVSHDEIPGPQALLASFEDLLAKARLTATDLPPGLSLRADPEGRFARALTQARLPIADPAALPSTWLLDRRGRLVAHLAGPLTAAHRETLLAELEALR